MQLGASSPRDLVGCEMSWPGGVYNVGLNCGLHRPKEEVFKVFEPKRVDSILYTMIYFFNRGTQATNGNQLSFVPRDIHRHSACTFCCPRLCAGLP